MAGSGSVVGLILGGVLTSSLGWRWVLFINVPITLGAAALAPVLIRESRAETTDRSIDYAGAALVTGGLVAILYTLVNAGSAGWGSAETIGLLGLGAVLLGVFAWSRARSARWGVDRERSTPGTRRSRGRPRGPGACAALPCSSA